jgi:hypothetical protein
MKVAQWKSEKVANGMRETVAYERRDARSVRSLGDSRHRVNAYLRVTTRGTSETPGVSVSTELVPLTQIRQRPTWSRDEPLEARKVRRRPSAVSSHDSADEEGPTHVEGEEEVLDVLVEECLLDELDRRLGRPNRLAVEPQGEAGGRIASEGNVPVSQRLSLPQPMRVYSQADDGVRKESSDVRDCSRNGGTGTASETKGRGELSRLSVSSADHLLGRYSIK